MEELYGADTTRLFHVNFIYITWLYYNFAFSEAYECYQLLWLYHQEVLTPTLLCMAMHVW